MEISCYIRWLIKRLCTRELVAVSTSSSKTINLQRGNIAVNKSHTSSNIISHETLSKLAIINRTVANILQSNINDDKTKH